MKWQNRFKYNKRIIARLNLFKIFKVDFTVILLFLKLSLINSLVFNIANLFN